MNKLVNVNVTQPQQETVFSRDLSDAEIEAFLSRGKNNIQKSNPMMVTPTPQPKQVPSDPYRVSSTTKYVSVESASIKIRIDTQGF